jgi:hypothetical protein
MCEIEVDYWQWCARVTEKLTFMRLKVADRKDISDEDYSLLKALYPVWYNGNYPIYQTKMEGTAVSITQASLFDSIPSDTSVKCCENTDGTVIDNKETEPII